MWVHCSKGEREKGARNYTPPGSFKGKFTPVYLGFPENVVLLFHSLPAAMFVHKAERSVKAGLEKAVAFVARRVRSLFLGRDTARKKPVKQRPVFDA